jgi:hypothetical protein
MGGACSTHGRYEKFIQCFWFENLETRDHSEDPGIGGKVKLEWISGKKGGKIWAVFISDC